MIKAVIFDMDGTLIDASPAICYTVNETVKELLGRELECDVIRQYIGRPIWEFFEGLTPELKDRSREASAIYRTKYEVVGQKMTTILPYARDTLSKLKKKGIKVAVVSQRPEKLTREVLTYMGLMDLVDVVTSGEETEPKPSPKSLLLAMRMMKSRPSETLMVGDATFDIVAGRAAGVRTVAVLTGVGTRKEFEKAGADRIIEKLNRLETDV